MANLQQTRARPPLPQRYGLDPAWVRSPDRDPLRPAPWLTMRDWLTHKLGAVIDVDAFLQEERFVYASGVPASAADPYRQGTMLWFHRDLPRETQVPGEMPVVYLDDRIVVVDKPPFLSTIPRGKHVLQSVVVRLRTQLGLPELTPAHRLDRVTSGLLLLTTQRRWRGAYQTAFQQQHMQKVYRALARTDRTLELPTRVENHIRKREGNMRVDVLPDAPPNAVSTVEVDRDLGDTTIYRLTPHTGKTHQLRQHMLELGIPILGDPLYPVERRVALDDFREPLQLLASELAFTDPIDGTAHHFVSDRELPIVGHHPVHAEATPRSQPQ